MINNNNAYTAEDLHNIENNLFNVIDKTTNVIANNIGVVQNYILDRFSSYLNDNEEWRTEYSTEYQYNILTTDESREIWTNQYQAIYEQSIGIVALNMCNSNHYEENVIPYIRDNNPQDLADLAVSAIRGTYGKILICVDYLADFICNGSIFRFDDELKTAYIDAVCLQFINHERRHSQQSAEFASEGRTEDACAAMVTYNEIPSEIDANAYGMRMAIEYIKEEYNV